MPKPQMLLANVLYGVGDFLVQEDIKDFPWTDVGSKTHPGLIHHGFIGMMMQLGGLAAGHAIVAQEMAESLADKDVFQEVMETWEETAYPTPGL
ncbi:MAG: hypothetical protein OK454_08425 [Thaumarchaeota archaeon]|nr:hypothetical protein [Nitrososphaerota archaeon]